MPIKHIVIFTEREDTPELPKGIRKEWCNPKCYDKPRENADAVYCPHRPHIEEEYRALGKVVWRPEEATEAPVVNVVEEDAEEVTTNWRDLSWPKMRSLAKNFTDEPIKSKDEAIKVLTEAYESGEVLKAI